MDTKLLMLFSTVIAYYGPVYSQRVDAAPWSYKGDTGPEFWSTLEGGEACDGTSQSPIDIQTDIAMETEFDPFMLIGYDREEGDGPQPGDLFNNGHAAVVTLEGDYFLSGGGLPSTYKAFQFHLHWGSDDSKGSEHTKNGKQYPAELHIVHYDTLNYPFVFNAVQEPEGLAVLGFFFEIGEHNAAWDPIINSLSEIKYKDQRFDLEYFKLTSLLPSDFSKFYRYSGSLTTPGCFESVIWTVFEQTITVSEEQIAMLRTLSHHTVAEVDHEGHDDDEERLVDTYRPVQPLNMRSVYQSFPNEPEDKDDQDDSCANKCGDFDEMASCQCNSMCQEYGDCCEDYMDYCMVEICTYVPTFKNKLRKQRPPGMPELEVDVTPATRR